MKKSLILLSSLLVATLAAAKPTHTLAIASSDDGCVETTLIKGNNDFSVSQTGLALTITPIIKVSVINAQGKAVKLAKLSEAEAGENMLMATLDKTGRYTIKSNQPQKARVCVNGAG